MTRAVAAAFAAVFVSATIASAHAAAPPKDIAVAYGDLDLSAAAGRSQLKLRLEDAAAKLCGPVSVGPDYRGSEQSAREQLALYHACIGRLSERAMAQIPMTRMQTGRN